jgi:hypothetical protein
VAPCDASSDQCVGSAGGLEPPLATGLIQMYEDPAKLTASLAA